MPAVIAAMVVGLVAGVLPRWRAGRPVPRNVAVALIGACAGALLGGLAGTLLAEAAAPFLWVDAGIVGGSISGAVIALRLDHLLDVTGDLPSTGRCW